MLKLRILYIFVFFQIFQIFEVVSQEAKTIIDADFTIRDFYILKDSVFFIKKRDVYLSEIKHKRSKNYFIGGYGLEMETSENSNTIITASNELVRNVSSVRFYNKKKDEFDAVFYYKEGKILDFLLIPETKLFVLSLTNKKIIVIDYQNQLKFLKTIEINLNDLSRKLNYKNNILYYATDKGKIYEYNLINYKKELIYEANELITDFVVNEKNLIYSTIKGEIIKVNLDTNKKIIQKVNNNFINTIFPYNDDKLICGSWDGKIYIFDINNSSISRGLSIHKRAVLKIKKGENNTIYSSGLDKTIKQWTLN